MNRRRLRISVLIASALAVAGIAAAQDADQINEGPDMMKARQEWFFNQRAYPLGFIPAGLRERAVMELNRQLEQRASLRARGKLPLALRQNGISNNWTLIGPNPTHNLPFGGLVTAAWTNALAVDPRNANTAYLGAPDGGVWKTTDGGVHWTPLTDTQPSLAIGSLALDPSNPDIIYAGTGDSYSFGDGVLKSTDGGNTWNYITGPFGGPTDTTTYFGGGAHINQLSVHPTNGQIVLAAVFKFPNSAAGLYRTTDGGATWAHVFSNSPATAVAFDPNNGNIAYAAISDFYGTSQEGFYKSIDGGLTWNPANGSGSTALPLTGAGVIQFSLAPSASSTIYVTLQKLGSFGPQTPNSIYKSTDGGLTWNAVANLPSTANKGMIVTVHPTNPNIVFVGEVHLFRSLNGGMTWTDVNSGLFGDIRSFGFSPNGGTFYVGCDGGVWSTPDAANPTINFTDLNATLAITQFYPGLSIHPTDPTISYAGAQDQGVQRYSGTPIWNTVINCDGGWTAIDSVTPNNAYATCQFGGPFIYKTTNGGSAVNSWTQSQTGINTSDRITFIPPMVIDPSHPTNLYFGSYRAYLTTNSGGMWAPISPDLTRGSGTISALAVSPLDMNRVWVGTTDGYVQTSANATSGAATWTNVSSGLPNRYVAQVVADPGNAMTAYAIFSGFTYGSDTKGHVFKTTNAGVSWSDISSNLPNVPADDLAVDLDISGTLYLATDIGTYVSTNGGGTWNPLGLGLPRAMVTSLKLHRPSRKLRAGTLGRSVWDLPVPLGTATAMMTLSQSTVNFGTTANGSVITSPQNVGISFTNGTSSWSASSSSNNIVVMPLTGNGNGSVQISVNGPGANGTVTITAPGAVNSPQQIQVNIATVTTAAPFGSFDTPANNATGQAGAIPVTGWGLDNVEVTSATLYREPISGETPGSNGLVFIGNAVFVVGARPDVQASYPMAPFNYRAGWGYLLLTNFLPNSGNGTFKLHVILTDKAGLTTDLGAHTITCDNLHASKPFGAIDTPTQGGTASGASYVNFGWALTQNPYMIPNDGSTMTVYVDGVLQPGHVNYNNYRSDIATLFPGYSNSNGAVGYYMIDTTKLSNAVHTIFWIVADNATPPRADGIGSRYWTVANTGAPAAAQPDESAKFTPHEDVRLRTGYDASAAAETLERGENGQYKVEIPEMGRIELDAGAVDAYLIVGGERRPLPIGSTLKDGVLYWQAGLGFHGEYTLELDRPDGTPIVIHVIVE